jgi:NADPH-dependent ferric siderophore reductase
MQRLVLTAQGLEALRFTPGQDLMLRVPRRDGDVVNRRYTIRHHEPDRAAVTIDVSLHGRGPGTDWVKAATAGTTIQAIGPRGKITLAPGADWHLFVGDETGLPGSLAMIEALPAGSTAVACFEVDTPSNEQQPVGEYHGRPELRWVHRLGNSTPGDTALLLDALSRTDLPQGDGHAYLAAEAGVVRAVRQALVDRGLRPDQVSAKAYWRRGLPNAEHGEPTRDE